MHSLVKRLFDKAPRSLAQHYETRVDELRKTSRGWELFAASENESQSLGAFDRVIVTLPAPQAALLTITCEEVTDSARLQEYQTLCDRLAAQVYDPCWALMVGLDQPLNVDWGGAFLNGSVVKWASRTNTKPGRAALPEALVLHAQVEFSQNHFEAPSEEVAAKMLTDFWAITGIEPQTALYTAAHRWRYSIPRSETAPGLITDNQKELIFCGDWSAGSKIEGAFLSGICAAGLVMSQERNAQAQGLVN